jgi:uncharacterized membrane protein
MKRIRFFRRGRRASERGATLVFTAISMVLLLWAGATGVDVGFSVYGSRQAQALADTTALDLARYLSYIDSLPTAQVSGFLTTKVAQIMADNKSSEHPTAIPGYYDSVSKKFKAGGFNGTTCQFITAPPLIIPGCNAIEVTTAQTVPQIFFGGFNALPGHSGNTTSGTVSSSSVATQTPESGFSIGTYLVNFNSQQSMVLNGIFGPLGSNVNITAVGYDGLATTNVTIAQLISASNGLLTPSNIMTTQLTAGQWLGIWQRATLSQDGAGSTAYTQLLGQSFTGSSSTLVSLCNLVNINTIAGQINCTNSSMTSQGLLASVNVLQMLTTEAELYNTNNNDVIDVTSALGLSEPGLTISGVTLTLKMIQPPQVAYGPVGTIAKTAQVQATLSMNLAQNVLGVPLNLGSLSIPLAAATGQSTLFSMTCQDNAMQTTTINTTTNALSTNATLSLLGVVSTEASVAVGGVSGSAGSKTFAGPAGGGTSVVPPTTASETAVPPTNPVTVTPATAPLTITPSGGILNLVSGLLTGPVNGVLLPVLQAAGVSVAGAQVTDLSANCGPVSLVQ